MMADKSLQYWQKRVYQLVFIILALLLLFLIVKIGNFFQELVISFIVAILASYLLGRPVDFLTKFIRVRGLSVLVIFLLFIVAVSWLGSFLFPIIVDQLKLLKASLPMLQSEIQEMLIFLDGFLLRYNIHLPLEEFKSDEMFNNIAQALTQIDFADFGSFLGSFLIDSVSLFVYLILIGVFSFYMLLDGKQIWETVITPFTKMQSEHLSEIKKRIDKTMHAYIYGQFQIAFLTASVMLVTYLVLEVPYAILLGLVQMLEIIPVAGTWLAIIPCLIVVAIVKSPMTALFALIVYLAYTQIIRDYLLAPRIMGNVLGFHPIGVMLAIIVGAKLGGLAGVIMALPIIAAINEVFGYFIERSKLKKESLYFT